MKHHLKSNDDEMIVLDVTPESAGWEYLSFRVIKIRASQVYMHSTEDTELALVPLEGGGQVRSDGSEFSYRALVSFPRSPPYYICLRVPRSA